MAKHSSSPNSPTPQDVPTSSVNEPKVQPTAKETKTEAAPKSRDPDETIDPYETIILEPGFDPHATISEKASD